MNYVKLTSASLEPLAKLNLHIFVARKYFLSKLHSFYFKIKQHGFEFYTILIFLQKLLMDSTEYIPLMKREILDKV